MGAPCTSAETQSTRAEMPQNGILLPSSPLMEGICEGWCWKFITVRYRFFLEGQLWLSGTNLWMKRHPFLSWDLTSSHFFVLAQLPANVERCKGFVFVVIISATYVVFSVTELQINTTQHKIFYMPSIDKKTKFLFFLRKDWVWFTCRTRLVHPASILCPFSLCLFANHNHRQHQMAGLTQSSGGFSVGKAT